MRSKQFQPIILEWNASYKLYGIWEIIEYQGQAIQNWYVRLDPKATSYPLCGGLHVLYVTQKQHVKLVSYIDTNLNVKVPRWLGLICMMYMYWPVLVYCKPLLVVFIGTWQFLSCCQIFDWLNICYRHWVTSVTKTQKQKHFIQDII
jgi:hypothetical protein